ncbi:MAG: sigma factor-like helix-turn-helix DNA-binding protein [Leptonema sp. (in: bacteria)]
MFKHYKERGIAMGKKNSKPENMSEMQEEKRYFISEVFGERKFLLLREFANRKGLIYVDELNEHLESLKNIRGIGQKKLNIILEKIKNPEVPIKVEPIQLKEIEWETPIERVFRGSYHSLLNYCFKTGRTKLKDLKTLTLEEIRSIDWPGNAIYKSFLKKLEKFGIVPKESDESLDLDKHTMGKLTDDVKLNKAYQNAHVSNLREFLQLGREGRLAIKNYGEISENLLRELLKEHNINLDDFENQYFSKLPHRNMDLKLDDILPKMKEFLTQREYFIITNRAIEKKTLESVGSELDLTRERVRQIEKKAVIRTNIYIGPIIQKYAEEIYNMVKEGGGKSKLSNICKTLKCKPESVNLITYLAGYKDLRTEDDLIFIDLTRTRVWNAPSYDYA